eukprot:CAMPEP_0170172012 /NCGR_PEP_ID=MMETSP0040_2-20121228/5227_1 /TAXON_ID=641309 /ORGANISM="Lotharella oceanica, Strain CCMP622" /LENGTH=333 /DNA_ID=CAMNT_0010412419 /DNA_START=238 /DNA_END=1239 /DNA_ORIENTATION=+
MIAVNDLLSAAANIMAYPILHAPENGALCEIQGVALSWFILGSNFWASATACTVYIVFRSALNPDIDSYNERSFMQVFIPLCQGLPLVVAIIPSFAGVNGRAGAWCWIKDGDGKEQAFRFACFYIWVWLTIAYNIISYVLVNHMLQAMKRESGAFPHHMYTFETLKFYPAVAVVAHIFGTINRTWEAGGTEPPLFLQAAQVSSETLIGLLNAVMFSINPTVQGEMAKFLYEKGLAPTPDNQSSVRGGLGADRKLSFHQLRDWSNSRSMSGVVSMGGDPDPDASVSAIYTDTYASNGMLAESEFPRTRGLSNLLKNDQIPGDDAFSSDNRPAEM